MTQKHLWQVLQSLGVAGQACSEWYAGKFSFTGDDIYAKV